MSQPCPYCDGEGFIRRVTLDAVFDPDNLSNLEEKLCWRCTGSGEIAEDDDENDED